MCSNKKELLLNIIDKLDTTKESLAYMFLADRAIMSMVVNEDILISNKECIGMSNIKDKLVNELESIANNLSEFHTHN